MWVNKYLRGVIMYYKTSLFINDVLIPKEDYESVEIIDRVDQLVSGQVPFLSNNIIVTFKTGFKGYYNPREACLLIEEKTNVKD